MGRKMQGIFRQSKRHYCDSLLLKDNVIYQIASANFKDDCADENLGLSVKTRNLGEAWVFHISVCAFEYRMHNYGKKKEKHVLPTIFTASPPSMRRNFRQLNPADYLLADTFPTFLLLGFIYWCTDKEMGIYMAGNVGLSCTLGQYFKWLFRIERPWVLDSRITPVQAALSNTGGYSFPSGHTVRASATWGSMGTYSRKRNKHLWYIGWAVVLLVAFSRNYLGVHTLWDILGALALSVLSMLLLARALRWSAGGKNRDIMLCLVGCVVCFLPMLQAGCLSNAGAAFGMWGGWLLEKRFIRFGPCRDWKEKTVRFTVGAFGIIFIQTAFRDFLNLWMLPKYAGFFMMFAQMLFIMALYPFFFSKCTALNRKHCLTGILGVAAVLALLGIAAAGKISEDVRGTVRGK